MVSAQLESRLHHTPPSLFLGNDAAAERLALMAVPQARVNDTVRQHTFIWTLAHELRQPLSAMSSTIAVMQHDSPPSTTAQAVAIMGRQLRQMSRMVDDLLDAARLSSGKVSLMPELLDIREVMADAAADVATAAADRGQRLDMQCGAAALWVNADRQRLYQVFSNLLNNAIKFTGPGGRITFTADSHASTIAVRVRDTGRGIDRMALPRIFDLFAQAQPSGLGGVGIGLSVVKEIVNLHRGRIEAHSDGPGKGSEFVVTVPASPDTRS